MAAASGLNRTMGSRLAAESSLMMRRKCGRQHAPVDDDIVAAKLVPRLGWLRMACVFLLISGLPTISHAQEDFDFVQEVIDEDQEQHVNDFASMSDEAYERHQDELRQRQRAEEERIRQQQEAIERERNERIEQEREAAYEAELAKLSDEKKKVLQQQKKRDAAIVKRILKAAEADNHYAVLGLRNNREFRIPGRSIPLIPGYYTLRIPEVRIGHVPPQKIKRAYRERAKAVHPDKCRDGRAVQAFHAVENAASILLDETSRAAYDATVLDRRKARRDQVRGVIGVWLDRSGAVMFRTMRVFKLLGPFAVPVSILAVVII